MSMLLAQGSEFWSGPPGMAIIGVGALVALIGFIVFLKFGLLWVQSIASGAGVGLLQMVGMSLRKVSPQAMVNARIMSVKAGIPVETNLMEAHFLAKGNVINVVRALISASKAKIALDFNRAAAIDLAGRDVLDAVRTSVQPKVIDAPDPTKGKENLDAVAKDGIQLRV